MPGISGGIGIGGFSLSGLSTVRGSTWTGTSSAVTPPPGGVVVDAGAALPVPDAGGAEVGGVVLGFELVSVVFGSTGFEAFDVLVAPVIFGSCAVGVELVGVWVWLVVLGGVVTSGGFELSWAKVKALTSATAHKIRKTCAATFALRRGETKANDRVSPDPCPRVMISLFFRNDVITPRNGLKAAEAHVLDRKMSSLKSRLSI